MKLSSKIVVGCIGDKYSKLYSHFPLLLVVSHIFQYRVSVPYRWPGFGSFIFRCNLFLLFLSFHPQYPLYLRSVHHTHLSAPLNSTIFAFYCIIYFAEVRVATNNNKAAAATAMRRYRCHHNCRRHHRRHRKEMEADLSLSTYSLHT